MILKRKSYKEIFLEGVNISMEGFSCEGGEILPKIVVRVLWACKVLRNIIVFLISITKTIQLGINLQKKNPPRFGSQCIP